MEHYGRLWKTMEDYGTLWNTMEHYGTRWNTMEHDGTRWNTMEHDGTRWNTMEHDGRLWNTMEDYGRGRGLDTMEDDGMIGAREGWDGGGVKWWTRLSFCIRHSRWFDRFIRNREPETRSAYHTVFFLLERRREGETGLND